MTTNNDTPQMTTNDTPNTCPHCGEQGASIRNTHKGEEWFYDCGTGDPYRTLACSRISQIRDLKAEVERLRDEFLKSIVRDELQKKIISKQHDILQVYQSQPFPAGI